MLEFLSDSRIVILVDVFFNRQSAYQLCSSSHRLVPSFIQGLLKKNEEKLAQPLFSRSAIKKFFVIVNYTNEVQYLHYR